MGEKVKMKSVEVKYWDRVRKGKRVWKVELKEEEVEVLMRLSINSTGGKLPRTEMTVLKVTNVNRGDKSVNSRKMD